MELTRKLAGITLIGASLGLSALSGLTSNAGLSELLPGIPYIGTLGFVIAVSLVALGVAVSSEVALSRWSGAAVLAVLLAGIALADRQTNYIAFQSQVRAADQEAADRNAAYSTAVEALTRTRAEIETMSQNFALMQRTDDEGVKLAQQYLKSLGLYSGRIDGILWTQTEAAMFQHGGELRQRLDTLRASEEAHMAIVSGGTTVSEAPFDEAQASLYATVLTLFSLVLSFAGGYLANGVRRIEEDLDAMEQATGALEADILSLADFLQSRPAA